MDNGKGYYISSSSSDDSGIDVNLVYGEPSTGRRALVSAVQAVEKAFAVGRYNNSPGTVSISRIPISQGIVGWISARDGSNFGLNTNPALQRLFDYYLLQWLQERKGYSHSLGIRLRISEALGTNGHDEVKEHLLPWEPVLIEIPKVRVEGLDAILEQAEAYVSMAPLETR